MQVHPTRASVDLAIAGLVCVVVGLFVGKAAILAWGGALLVGLAIARAVTLLGVSRIRAAGFEMLWRGEGRTRRVARTDEVELEAEIRNRDSRAARYVSLRPVHSPELDVEIEPDAGEVPALGRLGVKLRVRARRVGRHGIHGLSLEVQGSPGLYEVPLTFANPFGIEVLPRPFATSRRLARGGRSRMTASEGLPGAFAGDGSELRELREHQPGDPFRRIAWKASARRGQLLVRENEREERDVVWLLLDASVEHWAGVPGSAPLDSAIDELASVAERHLRRGDRVGLGILGARVLAWIPPDRGPDHMLRLWSALARNTHSVDQDRSDLDELEVAKRVLEHMRPLDPAAAARVRSSELDRIARRVDRVSSRAPFEGIERPEAATQRERTLRGYLLSFGIGSPARLEPDRPKTDAQLADALQRVAQVRPRASIVYVWSPPPTPDRRLITKALSRVPRRRVQLRWVSMSMLTGLTGSPDPIANAVSDAISERARVAQLRGEHALKKLGVGVTRVQPLVRAKTELPESPAP